MTSDMRPGRLLALQGQAMRRFPVAYLAFFLLFVLCVSWVDHTTQIVDNALFQTGVYSFVTAGIAAIALRLFLETALCGKTRAPFSFFLRKDGTMAPLMVHLPGLFCLGLCLFLFADAGSESVRNHQALFLIPTAILLLLAALLRPGSASRALAAGVPPETIALFHWQCARHDGLALAFAGLVSFVTMLGLFAAIAALDMLSLFGYVDDFYPYTIFLCLLIVFPALGMAGLLRLDTLLGTQGSYLTEREFFTTALWFRLAFSYLILPLALLYMVILYAYLGRMMILQEWPENGVGLIIGIYLAFGFAVQMTCFGLRETGPVWVRLYERFFPYAVLPLAATLLIASVLRMSAYGVTEPRYFLTLFVIWLSAACVLLIFRRPKLFMFPLSLAGLLVLASFGPWGAQSLSLISQKQELRHLLDAIVAQAEADSTKGADSLGQDDQRKRLLNIRHFFEDRQAFDQIQPLFAARHLQDLMEELSASNKSFSLRVASAHLAFHSIKEYDWRGYVYLYNHIGADSSDRQTKIRDLSMVMEPESTILRISGKTADQTLVLDFADVIARIPDKKNSYHQFPSQQMTFDRQAGGLHVRLWVENADYRWHPKKSWILVNLNGHILFRFESEKDMRTDRLKNAL